MLSRSLQNTWTCNEFCWIIMEYLDELFLIYFPLTALLIKIFHWIRNFFYIYMYMYVFSGMKVLLHLGKTPVFPILSRVFFSVIFWTKAIKFSVQFLFFTRIYFPRHYFHLFSDHVVERECVLIRRERLVHERVRGSGNTRPQCIMGTPGRLCWHWWAA